MGKMKNLAITITEMARQLGDPYGFENYTVEYIAMELQISTDDVNEVLNKEVTE